MKNLIILFCITVIICSGCSSKNNYDELSDYDELMQFLDNNQDYTYNSTHTIINVGPSSGSAPGSRKEYQIEVVNGKIVSGDNNGLTAEEIRKEIKQVLEENKTKVVKYNVRNTICFPLMTGYATSWGSGGWVVCFDHHSHIIYYNQPWRGTWEWKVESIINISDDEMWINIIEVEGIYGNREKIGYCENEECRKFYSLISKPSESDYTVHLNANANFGYVNGVYQVEENYKYKSGPIDSEQDDDFMDYVTEIGIKHSTEFLQPYCDFKQFNKNDLICFNIEVNKSCKISILYIDECTYCFDNNEHLKSFECYGENFLKWEKQ